MSKAKMTEEEFDKWFHETLARITKEGGLSLWALYFLERAKGEGDPKKQLWVDKKACRIFSQIIFLYSDSVHSINKELKRWEDERKVERSFEGGHV